MALTVAEGEVVVTADMAATRHSIVDGIGQADRELGNTGKTFGSKLVGGIGSVLKGGAIAVGAVAAAGIGTALTKGFSRLNAIDQAKAKLEGLGNTTKSIDTIMDNALSSVKGTAFGLDEAGTTAASAVAAGIKPGSELTGVLKTIADTATIAGASMSDTGAIFNSVAARGKLQGDDLMQLQERGVPVLAFLAKHYGVTAQAASDMVSKGEVDFANFKDAMSENLGGAALSSGKTFTGAMSNFFASLGRIGAGLLTGVFPKLAPAFSAITTALGPVEGAAQGIGATIGNVVGPAIDGFVKLVQGAPAAFSGLGTVMGPIFQAIGSGFSVLKGLFGSFMSGLAPELQPLLSMVGQLAPLFFQLAGAVSPFGLVLQAITPLLPTIGALFGQIATTVGGALMAALQVIVPLIVQLGGVLAGTLTAILPTVIGFVGVLSQVFATLVPVVSSILAAVLPLATTLISQLAPIFLQLATAVLPIVASTLQTVATAVMPLVTALLGVLMPVIRALLPVVTAVFSAIVPIVTSALKIVQGIIQVVTGLITGNWSQAWAGIKNIVSGAWGVIKGVVTGAIGIVKAVVVAGLNIVGGAFRAVWSAASGVVSGAANAIGGFVSSMAGKIGSGISQAIGFVGSLPGKVASAVSGAGQWLVSAGRNVMEGFIGGLKAVGGRILDAVTSPIKSAIAGAKNLLGIHSPSRVFRQIGDYVGKGLEQGLKGSTSGVKAAAKSMSRAVQDEYQKEAAARAKARAKINALNSADSAPRRAIAALTAADNPLRKTAAGRAKIAAGVALQNRKIAQGIAEQNRIIAANPLSSKATERALKAIDLVNSRLTKGAQRQARVASQLKAANTALTKATKTRDDYRNTVVQGLTKFDVSDWASPAQVIDQLKKRVTQTKTFSTVMSRLRKAGLDDASYQQFIAAGVDSLPQAQALLSGGAAQIKQVASLQGQLTKASSSFATKASNELYGAGVNAAKGLVKGLQSQQRALDKQMASIARRMTRSVKKALGIHSPSRVFRDEVGAMMGAGIAEGVEGSLGGIKSALTGTLTSARVVGTREASRAAVFDTPASNRIDRSVHVAKLEVHEATDPLGSAGRIRRELETFGRQG